MVAGRNFAGVRWKGWHRAVLARWGVAKKAVPRWMDFGYRLEFRWQLVDRCRLHWACQGMGRTGLSAGLHSTARRGFGRRLVAKRPFVRRDDRSGWQPFASVRRTVGRVAMASPGRAGELCCSLRIRIGRGEWRTLLAYRQGVR